MLRRAEVKGLMLRNFVDLSLPALQFSAMPPRIDVRVPRTLRRFYTFLSAGSCLDLVADLKSRKIASGSAAVTDSAFNETDRRIHAAGMKWFDLRRYFIGCLLANTKLTPEAIGFMSGYVVKEDDLTHLRDFFNPKVIKLMREGYVQVEKQFFIQQMVT